jgi:hypothetical protein
MALTPAEVKAVSKANQLQGAATVIRVRRGTYQVPSATEAGVLHTVCGEGPSLAEYCCSCVAGQNARICWHLASVHLRRVQEDAKAQMRRIVARRAPGRPLAVAA